MKAIDRFAYRIKPAKPGSVTREAAKRPRTSLYTLSSRDSFSKASEWKVWKLELFLSQVVSAKEKTEGVNFIPRCKTI